MPPSPVLSLLPAPRLRLDTEKGGEQTLPRYQIWEACRSKAGERGLSPHALRTHLGLDHVDSPRAQRLHTVVNVHDPLALSHVQHHVQDNVTACPPRASTGGNGEREENKQIWG